MDPSSSKCCRPEFARLDKNKRWRARVDDTDKWIQIDLINTYTVTGIVIQGYNSWVKTCKVEYEEKDGSGALVYIMDKDRNDKVYIRLQSRDVGSLRKHFVRHGSVNGMAQEYDMDPFSE